MSQTIRKVLFSSFGGPEVVSVVRDELPPPPANHVQVRPIYAGLGGSDFQMRNGTYPMQRKAPLTPGYCCVGRITANGEGSTKHAIGDLVISMTMYDSEADLVNIPEKYIIPLPAGQDLKQVVPLILDWSTAYDMVYRTAKIQKGPKVFIHGLSGAVGYAIFKLCQLEGAEIYGTASSSNHAALKEQGATAYVYSNKDWMKTMQDMGGADVVFDALGFESWDESWEILSRGGHLIGYGANLKLLNGEKRQGQTGSMAKLIARGLVPFCPYKTSFYYITRDQSTFVPELRNLMNMQMAGRIEVPIKRIVELEEVPWVHENWTKMGGFGSVLVRVSEE